MQLFICWSLALLTIVDLSLANSLYDKSDSVTELNANNFIEYVYSKDHITIVNFYLHWCPHCIHFSKEWKRLAEDIKDWHSVVNLAAVDCAVDHNKQLCQLIGITRFPKIRLFGLNARTGDQGIHMDVSERRTMKNEIIDYLLKIHQKLSNQLHVFPLEVSSKDEFFNSVIINRNKQNFVFLEKHPSYLTAQIILDFSSFDPYVNLYRVLDRTGHLSHDLFAHSVRLPSLVQIYGNHSFELVASAYSENEDLLREEFALKIRQSLNLKSSDPNDLTRTRLKSNTSGPTTRPKMDRLSTCDLYNTLRYSLHKEVPRYSILNATQVLVLKNYFSIIYKYFPFDNENVRRFFKRMNVWFANKSDYLDVKSLKAAMKISDGYLPPIVQWVHCAGSRPHFRGYPCGLWSMFHVMTVSEYKQNPIENNHQVLPVMKQFITNFFSCEECSNHFARISRRLESSLVRPESSVLWLWRVHNQVNHRTKGSASEDPLFPKVQFPTQGMCEHCYKSNSEFNETAVFEYLLQVYEPKNLTKSADYFADQRILNKNLATKFSSVAHFDILLIVFVIHLLAFF